MNLQEIAEAYSQVHEKKDSSYLETDMKKRQANNEKAIKDMEKVKGQKNPHFEEAGADEKRMKKFQELQKNVDQKKKNIRGNDSAEQKARLEKKRGMKLDDHPQFKKEEVSGIAAAYQAVYSEEEVEDIEEADSLAAMAARREKRLKAQRKKEGTSATGQDFGHDYGMPAAERKKKQKAEFDAFIGRGKKKTNEEVEAVDEGLASAAAGALEKGANFMNTNPVGKAVKKVLKPAGSGSGTARPAAGAKPGTAGGGATTRPMMNSFEPEGEMVEGTIDFKNAIHEAYEEDIKEFVGGMIKNAAQGVVNSAGQALASPVGAALAGGTVGAVTGGKKKTKKCIWVCRNNFWVSYLELNHDYRSDTTSIFRD